MPDRVKPDRGLWTGTSNPDRREQIGKGERMNDRGDAVNKYPLASSNSARDRWMVNCETAGSP